MAAPPPPARRLERLPAHSLAAIAVVAISLAYVPLDVVLVRPYLWPAGPGAIIAGGPASRFPLVARPPDWRVRRRGASTLEAVALGGPAARQGLAPGVVVLRVRSPEGGAADLGTLAGADDAAAIEAWRAWYRLGLRGPVVWTVRDSTGAARDVTVDRVSALEHPAPGWGRIHLGMIVQIAVFTGGALVLLLLRTADLTANLCVLALGLSAAGSGGPVFGMEGSFPPARLLALFAWVASPLAFPTIALAILHFPTRSPLIVRYPWVQAVPFAVAAPMIGSSLLTALYLSGVDSARGAAIWDATHPGAYNLSFAAALGVNFAAIAEGLYRFRVRHDANERRRIRMAIYTAVPGVSAYALKDGVPIVAMLGGTPPPVYPTPIYVLLQALVLLPAFGLVYAVGVDRVLGPRLVLRRSLQYALARRTLAALAALPALALILSLIRDRGRTVGDIAASSAGIYVVLILVMAAGIRYRERTRRWLDQRFFREEYDAREILLSLASRVRFETDPADLAAMVVNRIDEALHPDMVAIMVSGLEDGRLVPVTVLHGSADSLPIDGGISGMLRWSELPLDVPMDDPRSAVRRLPADEQDWLRCTRASLLVPVVAQDRALVAVIVLGERRSEEPYTDEDRQLLGSIAAQMGLGFDVARLRRSSAGPPVDGGTTRWRTPPPATMVECPRCGRCEEAGTVACPDDGVAMRAAAGVPRVVDNKYRIEQLLGRGGMGAVYRARDVRLERLVALKVVRAELLGNPDARLRFRREAQIVARLQHPSIVSIFDYGTFADGAFLVMELVPGEDLRHLLRREGRVDAGRASRILHDVCAAIDAAHRHGVLHRDLKPENILLPGGAVEAKVLDFGVAKVVGTAPEAQPAHPDSSMLITAPGLLIGTPAYMAPEQLDGQAPDARTDIFSLGIIAYEMLAGTLPFGRGTLAEIVIAHTRGAPPMPRGTAPEAVELAIRSAFDLDPGRRPASAGAFARLVSSGL